MWHNKEKYGRYAARMGIAVMGELYMIMPL
jgi:hypothetical protein